VRASIHQVQLGEDADWVKQIAIRASSGLPVRESELVRSTFVGETARMMVSCDCDCDCACMCMRVCMRVRGEMTYVRR
jgi:hypothetical protein